MQLVTTWSQVRFMNCPVEGNGVTSPQACQQLVQQVNFNGMTPLGTALDAKVIPPPDHSTHAQQWALRWGLCSSTCACKGRSLSATQDCKACCLCCQHCRW